MLLSEKVSQPYIITGSTPSLNAFLFSLIGMFLSRMTLSRLENALYSCQILLFISCSWSRSLVTICSKYMFWLTSSIFFPSTITSFSGSTLDCREWSSNRAFSGISLTANSPHSPILFQASFHFNSTKKWLETSFIHSFTSEIMRID